MGLGAWAGRPPRLRRCLIGPGIVLAASVVLVASLLASSAPVLAASSGVRLSEGVPRTEVAVGQTGGVFRTVTHTVTYRSGKLLLSSSPDGSGDIVTDDGMTLQVKKKGAKGPGRTLDIDFSRGCTVLRAEPPVDVTNLFDKGVNEVTLVLRDRCGVAYSSRPYYLTGKVAVLAPVLPGQLGRGTNAGVHDDPVNTGVGNLTREETDLAFPDHVFGLEWGRAYNSRDDEEGVFGQGWRTSVSATVAEDDDDVVMFRDVDGRTVEFTPVDGGYPRPAQFPAELVKEKDGTFSIRWFAGETWRFDAGGRLAGRRNWDGQAVEFSYEGGRLASVSGGYGYGLTFTYDATGRISKVTASDGRQVSYGYRADGLLGEVIDPAGATTSYGYDDEGRLSAVTDADGVRLVQVGYDSDGRVISQVGSAGAKAEFAYDADDATTSVTDVSTGSVVRYRHDERGQLLQTTDPTGASTAAQYDEAGNPVASLSRRGVARREAFDAHGSLTSASLGGATVRFVHDGLDRLVEAVDANGGVTRFTYDGESRLPSSVTDPTGGLDRFDVVAGQVRRSVDADGVEVIYGYDAAGNLTSVTNGAGATDRFEYDAAGRLTSVTSPLGAVERRRYDPAGRLLETIDPTGAVTAYRYTPAGRPATVVDPTGATTSVSYNALGLPARTVDPNGAATSFTYDDAGNQTSVTDPSGGVSRFSWDPLGRLVAETDPTGGVTRHAYDADGNEISTVDPLGAETRRAFDGRGRPVSQTDPTGAEARFTWDDADQLVSMVDPMGGVWRFEYDRAGRVTAEIDPLGGAGRSTWTPAGRLASEIDPLGRVTRYRYDQVGRLAGATSPGGGVTRYDYDAEDRLVARTSAAGLVTAWAYDRAGRVVRETAAGGGVTASAWSPRGELQSVTSPGGAVRRFEYDPGGRMIAAVDANGGTTRYGYDPAGRVISVTDARGGIGRFAYDAAGRETARTDPLGRTTRTTYDAAGQMNSVAWPSGEVVNTGYDPRGLLRERSAGGATVRFAYDAAGRRVAREDSLGTTRYQYDQAGRLVALTRPDGSVFSAAYDAAGQLTTRGYPSGRQLSYGYNADGDLIRLTLEAGRASAGGSPAGSTLPETISYQAGRAAIKLLAAPRQPTGPEHVSFETDPDGRLLLETLPGGRSRRYEYRAGLLASFSETRPGAPATTTRLERNADDRVTAEVTGAAVVRYAYDAAGQLTDVSGAPGGPVAYRYDATGNRSATTTGGATTTTYAYDAAHQLTESRRNRDVNTYRYDDSGRLQRQTSRTSEETFGYDPFGHLATRTTTRAGRTETRTFTYDGDDLLAAIRTTTTTGKARTGQATDEYLTWSDEGDIPQVLSHAGPGGPTEFIYGYRRLVAAGGPRPEVFTHDVNGSHVTGPGTAAWSLAAGYGPFGDPTGPARSRPDDPAFGYRGELSIDHDLYLRARTYDPDSGRFTTPDPLDGIPGEVTAANPYPYAANDPVNAEDPLGLRPTDATFGCPPGRVMTELRALGGFRYQECRPPKPAFGLGLVRGIGGFVAGGARLIGGGAGKVVGGAARAVGGGAKAVAGGAGRFLGGTARLFGRGAAATGRFAVRHRGTLATIGATAGCFVPAVGQAACGGLQAGAYGVRAQQRGYRNIKTNTIDAALTAGGIGAGALTSRAAARAAAARSAPRAADAATDIVRYDPQWASRQLAGQNLPGSTGWATTPGGRTLTAHAAERTFVGGPGRAPIDPGLIDDILTQGTRTAYRGANDTIRISAPHLCGRCYVVVDAQNVNHIVTVMVPK